MAKMSSSIKLHIISQFQQMPMDKIKNLQLFEIRCNIFKIEMFVIFKNI